LKIAFLILACIYFSVAEDEVKSADKIHKPCFKLTLVCPGVSRRRLQVPMSKVSVRPRQKLGHQFCN